MRIIKQQSHLLKQSDTYIRNELSNVAAVVQSPQILVEYFSIDPDSTPSLNGLGNIHDFIAEDSHVVYNRIEQLPMSGIDNLLVYAEYNDETAYDEEFSSNAIIFPNTIVPHADDCFIIPGSNPLAIYKVTDYKPITVRSNPFIEITFRLFSRDPEVEKQLRRQVKDDYITTVTSIGTDKSLVINKESYFKIEDHIKNYIEISELYKNLFWDELRSAFIFNGIYDEETGINTAYLDVSLWRLMFDEGIIINDDVITYALNNLNTKTDRVYTSCPDKYVNDYLYHRSILWRLYSRDHKNQIDEYKYPQAYDLDPQIGKFIGKNIYYFENYGKECDCNLMCNTCPTWDQEFVDRIKNGDPYPEIPLNSGVCHGCNEYCDGKPVTPYNPYMRNVIINWYNGKDIDWENLQFVEDVTCENYFIIPLVLAAYKDYINNLQK